MKKEDKELLSKELYARSPYGVKVNHFGTTKDLLGILNDIAMVGYDINDYEDTAIEDIKPYLRLMSSMTEEEFTELKNYTELKYDQLELVDWDNTHRTIEFYLEEIPHYCVIKVFDWLNAHHFDYRGLIEKGLALEAPKGMYKIDWL